MNLFILWGNLSDRNACYPNQMTHAKPSDSFTRANVPREALEEPDEAMVGEPHGRCRLLT